MNRLLNEDTLLDNFRKCYIGRSEMEESDAIMTFKGICGVIKNTESENNNDLYVKAIDDFISWAYSNGIDFSYMGKGNKNGNWFCKNVKERFLTGKEIYFIPFATGLELRDDELLYILKDKNLKELLESNSLFVELGCDENPLCVYDSKICCSVKDITTNGCYIVITDNDNGSYLKNCLDKNSNVYMAKSIIVSDNPTKFRLLKLNVIIGDESK